MSNIPFRVQQIDHVELFVPDQYEAAQWYADVLGLHIIPEFEFWAKDGPLMLTTANSNTKLALFQGEPKGNRPTAGHHRVAFGVDGAGFMQFLARLEEIVVYNQQNERLTRERVVDHGLAWSIYFCDPYGHLYEITTYDYDLVKHTFSPRRNS
ncbi:VOC family protein [Candidatus Leptofilum sp.]|uniref:VOC family protein n=1 Tax=Candidatus Leptofilum sp. TaxID=3241576 RepID=UPI003B59DA0A